METITWLHLSDLHFRARQAYDADVVLRALLRDIAGRVDQEGLRPDLIAVTGDLAFSGKSDEYRHARSFFDDLLQITGLSRERLFTVAGNHDVDRSCISALAQHAARALKGRASVNAILGNAGDRQVMLSRLQGYADFVSDYLGGPLKFDNDRYFYVRTLSLAGRQVAILGLNSAWLAQGGSDDRGRLALGERQVREALEKAEEADLKLALLHHPFDWLSEFDRDDCEAMLTDGCDFILHGHLHRTSASQLASPDGAATVLACGACYETRDLPNMYNWVRLDLAGGSGTVYLRTWSDRRGGFWTKDTLSYRNAPDGEYTFRLGEHLGAAPGPAHAAPPPVMTGPRIDAGDPPYALLRRLLQAAYGPQELSRLYFEGPFRELRYRFSPGDNVDDMIDEVLEYCRTQVLWEELLDTVARDAPRAYNSYASKMGWPQAKEEPGEQPPIRQPTGDTGLEEALAMARRTLEILERQAAAYTSLTIPPHLMIELEEQRKKVAELEARVGRID